MIRDTRPYSILVVEDNPGDLFIVEELLQESIATPGILHAPSFRAAEETLSAGRHHIDIILLDLTLPDRCGKTLVADMMRVAGDYPIIILTGYADLGFSISSITQGISDYLLKDDLTSGSLYKSITYAIERKKASAELKQSEKRFSDLFQLSPEPKWVYDKESGRIMQVNKAACNHYGYTEPEFLALSKNDLFHELPDEPAVQGDLQERTVKHRKKNGDVIDVEIHAFDLIIGGRASVSVLAIDVSEKLNFELRLTEAIIKAQENERYEIGSELHDNVCQILATNNVRLAMMRNAPAEVIPAMIRQCMSELATASKEIRRLSHQLAPAFHDVRTLEEEFLQLLETVNLKRAYTTTLTFESEFNRMPVAKELKLSLYRILQEHLSNIFKYANGTALSVGLSVQQNNVILTVSDNGVGFDLKAVSTGIGLANMKRRVLLYSGKLDIITSPGNGCTIVAKIPLEVRKDYAASSFSIR